MTLETQVKHGLTSTPHSEMQRPQERSSGLLLEPCCQATVMPVLPTPECSLFVQFLFNSKVPVLSNIKLIASTATHKPKKQLGRGHCTMTGRIWSQQRNTSIACTLRSADLHLIHLCKVMCAARKCFKYSSDFPVFTSSHKLSTVLTAGSLVQKLTVFAQKIFYFL